MSLSETKFSFYHSEHYYVSTLRRAVKPEVFQLDFVDFIATVTLKDALDIRIGYISPYFNSV